MFSMEFQPCVRGIAFVASSPILVYGNSLSVAVLLMIESEHKLLCTHKGSCQHYKSKIAQLSWFRHHLTQPLHTELNVESSTVHVDADACILLIQLSFHLFHPFVQRFWIAFPEVFATWELCGFAPTLERFLMIAARCFESSGHSNPCPLMSMMCLFKYCPCPAALGPTLSSTLTTTNCFSTSSNTDDPVSRVLPQR